MPRNFCKDSRLAGGSMIEIKFKNNDEESFLVFKRIYKYRKYIRTRGLLNSYGLVTHDIKLIVFNHNLYINRVNFVVNTNDAKEVKLNWKDKLQWKRIPPCKIEGIEVTENILRECFELLF